MTLRYTRPTLAALLVALSLAGCDAAGDDPDTATADTEDAALAVAGALAVDGGGLLEDVAAGAAVAGDAVAAVSPPPDGYPGWPVRPGCRPARTYDAAAVLYTFTVDCTRTNDATGFSAAFARVATVQFLGADGQPQPERAGATGVHFDILSGTTTVVTPRRTHRLLSVEGAFSVTGLGESLVTVNGTYARAATDTLRTARGGERTLTHEIAVTLTDVRGPRGVRADWHRAVSGTVEGTYHAVRTATGPRGSTTTREITRTFTVVFGNGGTARIAVDGERFTADLLTGEVSGVE